MNRDIQFVLGSLFLALIGNSFAAEAASAGELPQFSKIDAVVLRHFASLPGYQSGDLISRTQVQPVFRSAELLGWKVADSAAISNAVLPDSNYLVQEFRTREGREFMRKVSAQPLAFDQLDQISRLPGGKLMIKDFLRFPNSDLSFTKKSSVDVGRYARFQPPNRRSLTAPAEANLDQPTGRIYTVDALLARLRQSYDVEVERRAQRTR